MYLHKVILVIGMFNRKNLLCILIIALVLTLIGMYNDARYHEVELHQTIQTNGTPVSNHTVILDAGHGEPDRWSCF